MRPDPFIKAEISISIRNNMYNKKILSILIFSKVRSGITINTAIKGLNGSPIKARNPPNRNNNRYAVQKVPEAVNECLDKCHVKLEDVSKALLHQANEKMIRAILEKLYQQRGYDTFPESALPLTVSRFGNSSVATIPTLLDMILHDQLPPHEINSGDHLIFASVGAGMHANCLLYRMA